MEYALLALFSTFDLNLKLSKLEMDYTCFVLTDNLCLLGLNTDIIIMLILTILLVKHMLRIFFIFHSCFVNMFCFYCCPDISFV